MSGLSEFLSEPYGLNIPLRLSLMSELLHAQLFMLNLIIICVKVLLNFVYN